MRGEWESMFAVVRFSMEFEKIFMWKLALLIILSYFFANCALMMCVVVLLLI